MDCRSLKIEGGSIDLVVDKSTIDSLLCGGKAFRNTALMLKANAPQIYTEMLMYARRHFLVRSEMNLLQHGGMTNREATSLLLFAIIVESNEEDLIYVMV